MTPPVPQEPPKKNTRLIVLVSILVISALSVGYFFVYQGSTVVNQITKKPTNIDLQYIKFDRNTMIDWFFTVDINLSNAKDLGDNFYIYRDVVYYKYQEVVYETKFDYRSFKYIGGLYFSDKDGVYYFKNTFDLIKIIGADPKSFVVIDTHWSKDKVNLFYTDKVVENVDIETFKINDDGIAVDKDNVFFNGKILNINVDPLTVTSDYGFIKDKSHVYFWDYFGDPQKPDILSIADAQTFQYIGECACVEKSCANYYKDKNNVYVDDTLIKNSDPVSFQYFGAYDYYGGGMPSLTSYAKDKNAVYESCGEILENADTNTFENMGDGYARDKKYVWYIAETVMGGDVKTIQSLGGGYAKDVSQVYFDGLPLKNADPKTFEVISDTWLDDRGNKHIDIYGKDKNYVFHLDRIEEGVNPADCTKDTIDKCEI